MINIDDRILSQLDEKEMWLLIHIVKRLGADGTCWPSNETLLADTRWKDIRTLRRIKSQLEKKGIMKQYARYNEKNEQRSNAYKVLTDLIGVYKPANRLQTGGASNAGATGVHQMHSPGVHQMQGAGVHEMHPEVLSNEVLSNEVLESAFPFEAFWNLYDKKRSRPKCEKKWAKISEDDRAAIFDHVPKYKNSEPDKQFRKDPYTYLNNECWHDEIITRRQKQQVNGQDNEPRFGAARHSEIEKAIAIRRARRSEV